MSSQIPDATERTPSPAYTLTTASESEDETRRLDALHTAFIRYLGGKLSLAPIDDVQPQKILDLGCGSGAWAIHAAIQFPEAEVWAVDISPLPERNIPGNLRFKLADLAKELHFEKSSFDIVYARFVMLHVPNGEDAVKRAAELVRPGGFLIIDDVDVASMLHTAGPAVRRGASMMIEVFKSRNADGEIGRRLGGIITSTGYFSDVHVRKIAVPFSGAGASVAENELGLALKKIWAQGAGAVKRGSVAQAPNEALVNELQEELNREDCKAAQDLYFWWAQRALT
ncbi:S-adenosyl-L-methionine-dependent methyltransferase [Mycena galopus ATCC 62051]|nr:S-adenosyl-L-methionine-dependent methyltransferase [Mycena galopus ATCC 62051]